MALFCFGGDAGLSSKEVEASAERVAEGIVGLARVHNSKTGHGEISLVVVALTRRPRETRSEERGRIRLKRNRLS